MNLAPKVWAFPRVLLESSSRFLQLGSFQFLQEGSIQPKTYIDVMSVRGRPTLIWMTGRSVDRAGRLEPEKIFSAPAYNVM